MGTRRITTSEGRALIQKRMRCAHTPTSANYGQIWGTQPSRRCVRGVERPTRVFEPAGTEQERDGDEGEGEADPEAGESPAKFETEQRAERQAEDPVAGKVHEHGEAGFAETAECAGGDALDAIEDLESGNDRENVRAEREDACVGGPDMQNGARKGYEQESHAGHKAGANQDGESSGAAGASGIASSDGVADGDCGGGRNAKRNH